MAKICKQKMINNFFHTLVDRCRWQFCYCFCVFEISHIDTYIYIIDTYAQSPTHIHTGTYVHMYKEIYFRLHGLSFTRLSHCVRPTHYGFMRYYCTLNCCRCCCCIFTIIFVYFFYVFWIFCLNFFKHCFCWCCLARAAIDLITKWAIIYLHLILNNNNSKQHYINVLKNNKTATTTCI